MDAAQLIREANTIRLETISKFPQFRNYILGVNFEASNRMISSAGQAWAYRNLIQLSLAFFADNHNYQEQFRDTVLHELAHIIAKKKYGAIRQHGIEWKNIASTIGAQPERCHNMQLASGFTRRKGGIIPCTLCKIPIELGPTQYRRYLQTKVGYCHSKCPN